MANLPATTIEEFKAGVRGEVLLPRSEAYESARKIWNAMIDKRPALIARCTQSADVVSALNFARDNGLLLAIRGGGHNIAGNAVCDDGIVIDLSRMKAAKVDAAARRVSVDASGGGGAGSSCRPSALMNCGTPALSADGSVVVFDSDAGDLVPGGVPGQRDIYWVNWRQLPSP